MDIGSETHASSSGSSGGGGGLPQRKPSLFRKIFRRLPRSPGSAGSTASSGWTLTLTFTPVLSRKDGTVASLNHPPVALRSGFRASHADAASPGTHADTDDDKPYDEHSESGLDLHDIMLDEDADAASHHLLGEQGLQMLRADENAQVTQLLANLLPEDLRFPKYTKATRRNNRSPKILNNLFLAQELRCTGPAEEPLEAGDSAEEDSKPSAAKMRTAAGLHEVLVMEFSRDGQYLAVAGRDAHIRVWQVISSPLGRLKYRNFENGEPAPRDDDKKKQKVYPNAPVFLQEPVRVFKGHTLTVLCLDWSKNNFLLSGSMDKTVKLWNVERPECLETFRHCDFVTALRFHPTDDRFFASGALDNRLRLWLILEHAVAYLNDLGDNALITALEFTPHGNFCVVGGFNGSLYALETQGLVLVKRIELTRKSKTHAGHVAHTTISGIRVLANPTCADMPSLLLDKWNLLITTSDSTVRLVDLSLRKLVTRFKGNSNHSSLIRAGVSEDGRYIVCGSEDHWCYVWENNNAVINSKLRSLMKEMLLDSRNQLDERHKKISRLLHDNMLWKKWPVQMFLKDENGKKYIANNNSSYAAFHAHSARVNVALFAPEKSKRLLTFADDKIFDLVKRGTLLAQSRGGQLVGAKTWGTDHIIVTADSTGLVRVFRQDPAFYIRKNLLELQKLQKRDRSRTHVSSPDLGSHVASPRDEYFRAPSKSPTPDAAGIRNKLHLTIHTPYSRSNSGTSARAARLNLDLS